MAEIILHQYAMSPFSEKVRRVLAWKRLDWRAVEQPIWAPKPHLTPLTGGYRRIPVMQIGADVYCDTACIVRKLEEIQPTPTIYPDGQRGAAEIFAWWADRQMFTAVVPFVIAAIGSTLPPEFKKDREAMAPGFKIDALPAIAPHARTQFRAYCHALDRQLGRRRFLLGDAFGLADAACYHTLWFARMDPTTAPLLEEVPALAAWFGRVEAIDGGTSTPLSPDEALAIAADSRPATEVVADAAEPNGAKPGDRVTVTPDDYAFDPVAGEIVALTVDEIAIRRHDTQVGDVVVHFPRAGFRVAAA